MNRALHIDNKPIPLALAVEYLFGENRPSEITFSEECKAQIRKSHEALTGLIEKRVPVYGVNTGFGDSLFRAIPYGAFQELQANLVKYLMCGTGKKISKPATRAILLFRLSSLSRGLSGVSLELIERLALFLERDWLPVIPCQGSLGASGDLIPLAYIAGALQGLGKVETPEGLKDASALLSEYNLAPYTLKPKEGLALVNGTSAMCGVSLVNLLETEKLLDLAVTASSWMVLSLKGRKEAFGPLINSRANFHPGQKEIAAKVLALVESEDYQTSKYADIGVENNQVKEFIQDRYSLRCVPQVLGPVQETLSLVRSWLEAELGGVSDNPLVDEEGNLSTGGNFYGGYLSQGMDYLKISLGHLADLMDRQLTYLIDEKSNRGLPANLANWHGMKEEERFLHHGLKALHQSVSAITSEVLAKTTPNGVFSRSAESHNQDKVSLGMTAAMQCEDILNSMYSITAMHLTCLAQALDLRGVELKGPSLKLYSEVRKVIPFVERDQPLGEEIEVLASALRNIHEQL